ncbi:MAG: Cd(II)/Pb(II)-responsive transcriptional regulator [Burkholderiaceae bacterium]|nr:Cd(II)/Pb(II)-responsive transcriptional regulator [Burkholderiaceae bacterium]
MKIGQLANATGTQTETIRYYEREGLLPLAIRTSSNYRVYDSSHVERLAFIRHCRCLDMTLDEIRVLLHFKDAPTENCGEVDALLEAHIGHVVDRIRALQALEDELRTLQRQCSPGHLAGDCGILGGLASAALLHNHVPTPQIRDPHPSGAHRTIGSVHTPRERK